MAGITLVRDNFTGLALGTSISGRVPPTSNNGASWTEESGKHTVGGGDDDVKYVSGGASKLNTGVEHLAVRVTWYDGNGNELWIHFRDTANTAYPRYGYTCAFMPGSGHIAVYYENNYTFVQIGSNVSVTFDTVTHLNECVFEVNGDDFRVIVNDTLVHSFTDTTFQANGTRTRFAMIGQLNVDNTGRIKDVEIYDSYVIPGDTPASVPIVLVG